MASNYVHISVIRDDRGVIPYDDLEFTYDEYGEAIGFLNGFDFNHDNILKWVKDNNITLSFSISDGDGKPLILEDGVVGYRFIHPERLWDNDFEYLKNMWFTKLPIKYRKLFNQNYPKQNFDSDACYKIDEEFLLTSGYFDDNNLNTNMYWVDLLREYGYNLYFSCW